VPILSTWIQRHVNHQHEGAEHIYTGCTASATVTQDQLLAVSGDGTLAPAGAASAAVVGVALAGAASSAPVKMLCFGPVLSLTSTGAITAGAKVVTGAAGVVATIGANTFEKIVGTALTTAAGNVVKVVMHT
jgi:Uncharacterized conserved protein (DUF2190)